MDRSTDVDPGLSHEAAGKAKHFRAVGLHREIADIAKQPEMRDRLAADGSEALGTTPQEADRHISAEIARYTKLTRAIGLKVD